MILLKTQDLRKTYKEGKILTEVLRGVNLEIEKGKMCAITGASGSGKSTLLHILGTLDTKTSGSIFFNNIDLDTIKASKRASFRNKHLGFIYQFHHLLNDFSAFENIQMPLLIAGKNKQESYDLVIEMLDKIGLKDKAFNRPSELSGGQRQRVAIARALINTPDLILADEPTGNLDKNNAQNVFSLFENLVKDIGSTVIMVTHDESLASHCDIVFKMSDGVVIN